MGLCVHSILFSGINQTEKVRTTVLTAISRRLLNSHGIPCFIVDSRDSPQSEIYQLPSAGLMRSNIPHGVAGVEEALPTSVVISPIPTDTMNPLDGSVTVSINSFGGAADPYSVLS